MEAIFVNSKIFSWEKSFKDINLLQRRLFKSIYVGDFQISLQLQKIILQSSCARLLSIRHVTQLSSKKKFPGVDLKVILTFIERFELNEYVKHNYNNWFFHSLKNFSILQDNGFIQKFQISTISDRVWLFLVKLSIEPAHEAIFHPRNFGFRTSYNIFNAQNSILLNCNKQSFGSQKRLLKVKVVETLISYNKSYLLEKIIAPRSIKLCLSRLFLIGYYLKFESDNNDNTVDFSSLMFNILLDGVEIYLSCVHFGNSFVYFLKPFDNEKLLIDLVVNFFGKIGLNLDSYTFLFLSPFQGFDFLIWHFVVRFNTIFVLPSQINYQQFLFRVKRIVNNSNYGSMVKVNKLYPIIKEWRLYHRNSHLKGKKFSLFFLKKHAFKVFSKESRQDFYSSKRLLDRCFFIINSYDKHKFNLETFSFLSYSHMSFGLNILKRFFQCIHCGMKLIN